RSFFCFIRNRYVCPRLVDGYPAIGSTKTISIGLFLPPFSVQWLVIIRLRAFVSPLVTQQQLGSCMYYKTLLVVFLLCDFSLFSICSMVESFSRLVICGSRPYCYTAAGHLV